MCPMGPPSVSLSLRWLRSRAAPPWMSRGADLIGLGQGKGSDIFKRSWSVQCAAKAEGILALLCSHLEAPQTLKVSK